MPYPNDLLSTRAVIKPGKFAIVPPEGLVNNVIPGFRNCQISILVSPKIGASFVEYLVHVEPNGDNLQGFGGEGIETFVFCLEGEINVKPFSSKTFMSLKEGGYFYCPPNDYMCIKNESGLPVRLLLYKQRHEPLPGYEPKVVFGNIHHLESRDYDGMSSVQLTDLLPSQLDYDMNMHILTFSSPGSHPFIETNVQEHGAYILSGEGLYYLDNQWFPVKKGDFIWFGPFVPQAVYSVGREPLSYIYSKDCNRDVSL